MRRILLAAFGLLSLSALDGCYAGPYGYGAPAYYGAPVYAPGYVAPVYRPAGVYYAAPRGYYRGPYVAGYRRARYW